MIKIDYFTVHETELENIDEWLMNRGLDGNSVISISDTAMDVVRVWFRYEEID